MGRWRRRRGGAAQSAGSGGGGEGVGGSRRGEEGGGRRCCRCRRPLGGWLAGFWLGGEGAEVGSPVGVVDEEGALFVPRQAVGEPEAEEGGSEAGVVGLEDVGQASFADSQWWYVCGGVEVVACGGEVWDGARGKGPALGLRRGFSAGKQAVVFGFFDVHEVLVYVVIIGAVLVEMESVVAGERCHVSGQVF